MKFNIKNYYKPTPKKWRKVGDALLATGTFITSGGLLAYDQLSTMFEPHELKIIIGVSFLMGVVGKFITNMVEPKEEIVTPPVDQQNG